MLSKLRITEDTTGVWRQFAKVELDFGPRLTVLLGQNGTGKSTILGFLSTLIGYDPHFRYKPEGNQGLPDEPLHRHFDSALLSKSGPSRNLDSAVGNAVGKRKIGDLVFSNEDTSGIAIAYAGQKAARWVTNTKHRMPGVFLAASHVLFSQTNARQLNIKGVLFAVLSAMLVLIVFMQRDISDLVNDYAAAHFTQIGPPQIIAAIILLVVILYAFDRMFGIRNAYYSHLPENSAQGLNYSPVSYEISKFMELALMPRFLRVFVWLTEFSIRGQLRSTYGKLLFGSELTVRTSAKRVLKKFKRTFLLTVPEELRIRDLDVRKDEVHIRILGKSDSIELDAFSHGVAYVADAIWSLCLLEAVYPNQTLLILMDEPENHLHPGLQRKLLTSFIEHFENTQFVVSTHSPFFVGAIPEAKVCILEFDKTGKVTGRMTKESELDSSGTANEILRSVLDVPITRPIWVEHSLKKIVKQAAITSQGPDEAVRHLQSQLRAEHLQHLLVDGVELLTLQYREGDEK